MRIPELRIPELRPRQDSTIRWNSTFYMLKRFLESTLAIVNAPLTQEEWEVCRVLEPFEQVTLEISGERQLLQHHYLTQKYIRIWAVDEHLVSVDKTWTWTNKLLFSLFSYVTASEMIRQGNRKMRDQMEQKHQPQTASVWMLFDERATGDAAWRNPSADAIMEVRSYLEPLLQNVISIAVCCWL